MTFKGTPGRIAIATLLVVAAVVAVRWFRSRAAVTATSPVVTQPISRHDIALTIEASATVEPVDLVEVKSKASGQIVRMPVEVGERVREGELLAQIDTHDVQSAYDQALAAMRAAEARSTISTAQKQRADDLLAEGVITAAEHEAAVLDQANAQAALVNARGNLDLARQRRDDATVRAPIAGTILSQSVTAGQVISSATSSVSGGTALLTMADLARVRLRAMVSESDIGNVRAGQPATVTVEAHPERAFTGVVEKVEPQAVVVQSVTNFPVLVSIANDDGLLLPGMNGEVSLVVDRREGVLAVPVDAVRNLREAALAATALGLDPDSVRAQMQRAARGADSARPVRAPGADSARTRGARRGAGAGGVAPAAATPAANGNRIQLVFVRTASGIEPRRVRLGLSDFDWSEVVSGLEEGDEVVQLGVAEAQANRANRQSEIRQRMSNMPGSLGGGRSGTGTRSGTGGR